MTTTTTPADGPAMRGVGAYVLLSFALAWTAWWLAWRAGATPANLVVFQLWLLPGGFAPAIAALVVRRWVTGEGFADAGLCLDTSRWRYYLFALLWPFVAVAAITLLAALLGVSQPDFTLQRALGELAGAGLHAPPAPRHLWLLLPPALIVNAVLATPVLWGEEFGWRGYLQLRLFAGRPLAAAVATGLIWGVWHYPLVLMGYQYPVHPFLGLLVLPVGTVLLSIVFGWLRLRTGSVWSASLAHAATNAVGGSLTLLLFRGGPHWILVSYLGVLAWVPLLALCAWIVLGARLEGPPRNAGRRQHRPPS